MSKCVGASAEIAASWRSSVALVPASTRAALQCCPRDLLRASCSSRAPGAEGTQKRERPSTRRTLALLHSDSLLNYCRILWYAMVHLSLSLYAARSTICVARPVDCTLRSVPTSQQRVFSVLMARETIRVQDCSAADGTAVLIRAWR